jgi:hypothetical protein
LAFLREVKKVERELEMFTKHPIYFSLIKIHITFQKSNTRWLGKFWQIGIQKKEKKNFNAT